ncbi:MAG: hypothetical protein FWG70_07700 [Oscillospiraceae bacterium]|nr:hypothetical protein [Oscillospiraceae bacterium]
MIRMEIEFDEEKVKRENKYDIDKMWAKVDEFMLVKYKLKKTAPGVYSDYPGYDGYGKFFVFTAHFEKRDWFMNSLKRWDWVEYDEDEPNDEYREDWKTGIESRIHKRRAGA